METVVRKVAFIGATGMLGMPVALALAQAGHAVTALVRDKKKSAALPSTIKMREGNLMNPEDIRSLMEGNNTLYINLSIKQNEKPSGWHAESDGMRLLLPLARQAGIQRIYYLSALLIKYNGMNNFRWWAFDVKEEAVRMIKESGIGYTIFYPSTFMETITHQYKQGPFLLLAGESKYKQYFVASADFTQQVVRAFLQPSATNKEYVIQGMEGFTTDEAIAAFSKFYTKSKLFQMKAPLGLIRFYGRFIQKMNYGYHILEAINNYPEKFEAEETWKDLGRPQISLEQFARNA